MLSVFFHEMSMKGIIVVLLFLLTLITSCDSAINHKPFIDDSINIVVKVPEDSAVGTSIINITATDQENDPITFGLDDIGKTLFNIRNVNASMGELTLKKELNRESVKSYDFHVTVTDGGADRTTSKLFILDVLDVNDNKPVFVQQPYWKSIPENTTVGTTLLTIQATDADLGTNAVVTYRFSNDSNSAQDNPLITLWKTSKFAIDNLHGTITLASSLDYETTTRYLLPVMAEDGDNPRQQSTTTVVIDVTDISDNPPKFERSVYLKEIEENTPVGTTALTVVAKDGDAGINNPLKYEIYSGNDGTFAIDSSTGVITVNNTIDAEKTQSYKLYVRASEVPNPSSNATVSVLITVIDKNDNPPVFSQDSYSFTLRESVAKPGRIVTDVLIVKDADKNPEFRRFTYHLTGGDSDKFSIDPSSGELQINSTLDYETQVNYTFTVVVTETGTAEKYSDNATVHLTLINDNDNKPIFANPSYHYTFDEEIPPGKEIAVITATDADLGSFGQVTYELRGSQSSFFAVDSNTGNITAARTLDYEEVHSYQFYLIASDGGGVYMEKTSASINVTLWDVNDNEPVFTGTQSEGKIREVGVVFNESMAVGTLITIVNAKDKDEGTNAYVEYFVISGNEDGAFKLNKTSGELKTAKELDHETTSKYKLVVQAKNVKSYIMLSSQIIINVSATQLNNHQPRFTKVSTSTPAQVPKYKSFGSENSLLIVVCILVLIIIIIVACGMYYLRRITKRKQSLKQTADQSDGGRNVGSEKTFQMQHTISHAPNGDVSQHEPTYAELNPSTTLASTCYNSLSPSSRNISHAQVNETLPSSDEPLNYKKLQHNNAPQVYEKRIDLNDELVSTGEYEFVA